jgi:hypothetical protein
MFDELSKYKNKNHFFLEAGDDLETVCNAPDQPGVFLVYSLAGGKIELIYIGHSGSEYKEVPTKKPSIELGTLKEEILEGLSFRPKPNRLTWPLKLKSENIEALDVYWYVTLDKKVKDLPEDVERVIMQTHIHIFGNLPKWNRKR